MRNKEEQMSAKEKIIIRKKNGRKIDWCDKVRSFEQRLGDRLGCTVIHFATDCADQQPDTGARTGILQDPALMLAVSQYLHEQSFSSDPQEAESTTSGFFYYRAFTFDDSNPEFIQQALETHHGASPVFIWIDGKLAETEDSEEVNYMPAILPEVVMCT